MIFIAHRKGSIYYNLPVVKLRKVFKKENVFKLLIIISTILLITASFAPLLFIR